MLMSMAFTNLLTAVASIWECLLFLFGALYLSLCCFLLLWFVFENLNPGEQTEWHLLKSCCYLHRFHPLLNRLRFEGRGYLQNPRRPAGDNPSKSNKPLWPLMTTSNRGNKRTRQE